jgi:hypothetical protein
MDTRVDPLDDTTHHELVDLMRRGDFTDAVTLFARLVKLAYTQGQIDAFTSTLQRVATSYEDRTDQ